MKSCPRLIFIRILLSWLCCFPVMCWTQTLDAGNWISILSEKRDPKNAQYNALRVVLHQKDTVANCRFMVELEKELPRKNKRFALRVNSAYAYLHAIKSDCLSPDSSVARGYKALRLAYEIDDLWLIESVHDDLSRMHHTRMEMGLAIVHALSAMEIQESLGRQNFPRTSFLRYEIGFLLFHAKEYRASIQATRASIEYEPTGSQLTDTLPLFYKVNGWNTIGLAHMKLMEYDSAFVAYDRAYELATQLQDTALGEFWKGNIVGNRGDIYYQLGNLDSASVMLDYDYRHSINFAQYDNAANSLQMLARIHLEEGNPSLALSALRKASELERKLPKAAYRVNILNTFAQVYRHLGNADSLYYYVMKYVTLHDSLEQASFDSQAEIVQDRMEHQKSIQQLLSLNKEKKRIVLIRNFIIVVVLLLAALGYMFFHRERLKASLRQQKILQDKLAAEAEAMTAQEQLSVFTHHMLEKSDLVDALKSQLVQKEFTNEPSTLETEVMQFQILTDHDWEKFKDLFETVYPGFFQMLKRRAPDITLAEQRMASLIKLKVPSKKAATILGISPNSVYKTRQRLRHRLGLETDSELEDYFTSLEIQ